MKNVVRLLFLILPTFLFSFSALSLPLADDWTLASGKLTYHVHFPLKNVEGVSTEVKGKGHCDQSNCQFLVAAPVKSFDSGDGNRDNHMLETTKGAIFPIIAVKVSFPRPSAIDHLIVRAEASFAGQSHTYENVAINIKTEGANTIVSGRLLLMLSDFQIERPSLFMKKIDDEAPVDFNLTWK